LVGLQALRRRQENDMIAESTAITSSLDNRTARPRVLPPFAREEFDALACSLCRRVKEGSLPPDDAYWWVRMLCSDAELIAEQPESLC
jgi:hypothetical protein